MSASRLQQKEGCREIAHATPCNGHNATVFSQPVATTAPHLRRDVLCPGNRPRLNERDPTRYVGCRRGRTHRGDGALGQGGDSSRTKSIRLCISTRAAATNGRPVGGMTSFIPLQGALFDIRPVAETVTASLRLLMKRASSDVEAETT